MLTLHLSSLIKFLIGIVFLQGSTGLLVYTALRTYLTQTWPLICTLGVTLAAAALGRAGPSRPVSPAVMPPAAWPAARRSGRTTCRRRFWHRPTAGRN